MPGITRTRHDAIFAHAAHLLTQAGGVGTLDELSAQARKPALVSLARQLADAESITYKTARQHIARACRRARHPDYTPPRWGGDRTQPQEDRPMKIKETIQITDNLTRTNAKETISYLKTQVKYWTNWLEKYPYDQTASDALFSARQELAEREAALRENKVPLY